MRIKRWSPARAQFKRQRVLALAITPPIWCSPTTIPSSHFSSQFPCTRLTNRRTLVPVAVAFILAAGLFASPSAWACLGPNPECGPCERIYCDVDFGLQCTADFSKNGLACDDGNPCTTNDVCRNGVCGGTAIQCTPLDQCHVAGTCSGGICSNPPALNGSACNDGNPCTKNDICTNGTCAGTSYSCPALSQCQSGASCNGDGTCTFANKLNGTACNDGNACTSSDQCTNGTCAGTPYTCATNQCQIAATCNGDGTCAYTNKPDSTSCNNGLSCTVAATCQAGSCNAVAGSLCGGPIIVYAYDKIGNITSQRACATCASLGATCGNPSDGCGNILSCGTCAATQTCSSYVCH